MRSAWHFRGWAHWVRRGGRGGARAASGSKKPNMGYAELDVLGKGSAGSTPSSQHAHPTCTPLWGHGQGLCLYSSPSPFWGHKTGTEHGRFSGAVIGKAKGLGEQRATPDPPRAGGTWEKRSGASRGRRGLGSLTQDRTLTWAVLSSAQSHSLEPRSHRARGAGLLASVSMRIRAYGAGV